MCFLWCGELVSRIKFCCRQNTNTRTRTRRYTQRKDALEYSGLKIGLTWQGRLYRSPGDFSLSLCERWILRYSIFERHFTYNFCHKRSLFTLREHKHHTDYRKFEARANAGHVIISSAIASIDGTLLSCVVTVFSLNRLSVCLTDVDSLVFAASSYLLYLFTSGVEFFFFF